MNIYTNKKLQSIQKFLLLSAATVGLLLLLPQPASAATNVRGIFTWTNTSTITATDFETLPLGTLRTVTFSCTSKGGGVYACPLASGDPGPICNVSMAIAGKANSGTLNYADKAQNGSCGSNATIDFSIASPEKGPTDLTNSPTAPGGGGGSFGTNPSGTCVATDPNCIPTTTDPALQGDLTGCGAGVTNCNIVTKYLNPFIKLLSVLAGIAVVMGIIYGGIQYSASGGDPQKVAVAKRHIMQSIIALLAFFFLYAFLKFVIPGADIVG